MLGVRNCALTGLDLDGVGRGSSGPGDLLVEAVDGSSAVVKMSAGGPRLDSTSPAIAIVIVMDMGRDYGGDGTYGVLTVNCANAAVMTERKTTANLILERGGDTGWSVGAWLVGFGGGMTFFEGAGNVDGKKSRERSTVRSAWVDEHVLSQERPPMTFHSLDHLLLFR
jgi:hypothetical protein